MHDPWVERCGVLAGSPLAAAGGPRPSPTSVTTPPATCAGVRPQRNQSAIAVKPECGASSRSHRLRRRREHRRVGSRPTTAPATDRSPHLPPPSTTHSSRNVVASSHGGSRTPASGPSGRPGHPRCRRRIGACNGDTFHSMQVGRVAASAVSATDRSPGRRRAS